MADADYRQTGRYSADTDYRPIIAPVVNAGVYIGCSASEKARDSWKKYLAYENSKIVGRKLLLQTAHLIHLLIMLLFIISVERRYH